MKKAVERVKRKSNIADVYSWAILASLFIFLVFIIITMHVIS